MRHLLYLICGLILLMLLSPSCAPVRDIQFRKLYSNLDELMVQEVLQNGKPYLKAHMQNGDVVVFRDHWEADTISQTIRGYGSLYDFNRRLHTEDTLEISTDGIILFETNVLPKNRDSVRKAGMYLLGAGNLVLAGICITQPKACFGSCPTFYLDDGPALSYALAEAFSDAIAPALEYRDIDALLATMHGGTGFDLTMKNEAYETHMVRSVDILAVPMVPGMEVFHTPGDRFFYAGQQRAPIRATADEGDVTWLLAHNDRNERFSLSDPDNIRSKETIHLEFDRTEAAGQLGLAMGFRQSLMTTFLLYNAIDHMGHRAGDILAGLSRRQNEQQSIGNVLKDKLGGIDVYLWEKDDWVFQGSFYETGPIAINHQMLPFITEKVSDGTIKIKLELNRGMWRIDYVKLAEISGQAEPVVVSPVSLTENGRNSDRLLVQVLDPISHLVSMPGDVFSFRFEMPDDHPEYALFLAAEGYYLIWNREEWLQDQDLSSLYQMRYHPRRYLRRNASLYKEYEQTMEELFWQSRVNQQIITGHD